MTEAENYELQRAKELQAQAEERAGQFIARAHAVDDLLLQIDALVSQVKYVRYTAEREKAEAARRIAQLEEAIKESFSSAPPNDGVWMSRKCCGAKSLGERGVRDGLICSKPSDHDGFHADGMALWGEDQ